VASGGYGCVSLQLACDTHAHAPLLAGSSGRAHALLHLGMGMYEAFGSSPSKESVEYDNALAQMVNDGCTKCEFL